jgi:hypothetical protein
MFCILRLTDNAIGIEAVEAQLHKVVHLGELSVWSLEQSFLINAILTLDAIARTNPALVAECLGCGLHPFLRYCVLNYTIDLVTLLVAAGIGTDIMKEISFVGSRGR